MDDRVGSKIPSKKEIAQVLALLNEARDILKPYTITLTTEERKRLVRFRPGGELVVDKVGGLAEARQMALPGISVAGMHADLELAQTLAPVAEALEAFALPVNDTVMEAEAECWWAATAFYSALARIQATDPALEAGLKPVVQFFATGRRKKPDAQPK